MPGGMERALKSAFLLTPLREGRLYNGIKIKINQMQFLLTPLREGRLISGIVFYAEEKISTHAPAGGATGALDRAERNGTDFYSRPCGRGD